MEPTPYTILTPLADLPQVLARQGFAIIEDHRLTEETCARWKTNVWDNLEKLLDNTKYYLDRDDSASYGDYFHLFPMHSMLLQHWGVGHMKAAWEARERAAPIYASIWGVNPNDLLTSFDGLSFHLAPEHFARKRGKFRGNTWFHVDQSYRDLSYKCVQGYWNLEETGADDGCLSVLEGSHLYHQEFLSEFYPAEMPPSANWYKHSAAEVDFYKAKGCQWRTVCAPKGCFVVWLSNCLHCGTEPRLPRAEPRDRLVFYVSQLPRRATTSGFLKCSGATSADLQKRLKYYEEGRLTSHWCYPIKVFPKQPQMYGQVENFGPIQPPKLEELSALQKRLIGFD